MNVSSFLSQDADGLKVGVADLINQWVKGSEDGSRCSSPSKPGVCQDFTLNYQNCMKKCLFLLLSCCTFVNLSADLLSNKIQQVLALRHEIHSTFTSSQFSPQLYLSDNFLIFTLSHDSFQSGFILCSSLLHNLLNLEQFNRVVSENLPPCGCSGVIQRS